MCSSSSMRLLLCVSLLSIVVPVSADGPVNSGISGLPNRDAAVHRRRRIIFNDDNGVIGREGVDTVEEYLDQRLSYVPDSHVDSIWLSIMTRAEGLLYDARVGEPAGKHLSPESVILTSSGKDHYSKTFATTWNNLRSLFDAGTDTLRATVEFGHRHDKEVFASIRMNQVADSWTGDFFTGWKRARPECCLGVKGEYPKSDHRRLYWSALDYEQKPVRDLRVGMINDICTRYDVDGIELDFWRWPPLFRPSLDNQPVEPRHVEIMTDLFRRMRRRMLEIELERDRPLLLAARVFDTEELNLRMGLDVRTYLKEGLIDILVVGGDYNYYSVPAKFWSALAHKHGVPFYPCTYRSRGDEQDRAFASWYRSQGADGIYTFNFKQPKDVLSLRDIGDPELIARTDKHYSMNASATSSARKHVTAPGLVPVTLVPGVSKRALLVGDNVEQAQVDGLLKELRLRLTLESGASADDGTAFLLNGETLENGSWNENQVEFLLTAPPLKQGVNSLGVVFAEGASRDVIEVAGVDLYVRYRSRFDSPMTFELDRAHRDALKRRRRLMLHYDYTGHTMLTTPWGEKDVDQLDEVLEYYRAPWHQPSTRFLDTVVYELGEGPTPWQSMIAPRAKVVFPKWWEAEIDPLEQLVDVAKEQGREVFFSCRLNGSDIEEDAEYGTWKLPELKERHRDRLVKLPWANIHNWNFAYRGVRDLKVSILREVAGMYDVDGIQIDMARTPIFFPAGEQWENRAHLTAFMRQLREAFQEIARERGRPLLLAVRIPETVIGCTFDGMDVRTWIREQLVDILIIGCGASDVDVQTYRRLTAGTDIRIYPSWDVYHPTDGYRQPPVEYWRGLYSKWWELGAHGVHTFNVTPHDAVLQEIGDREGMRYRDKIFIVERRSGSHGPEVTGDPYNWRTPRHQFFMTYMLAPLPAMLDSEGKVDTLVTMTMTDDVDSAGDKLEDVTLRLLVSDIAAKGVPADQRIEPSFLWTYTRHPAKNEPPLRGVENRIEVRINNSLLDNARVKDGWLLFDVRPGQLARGNNLVGIRVAGHPPGHQQKIRIEKVELSVNYRDQESST